MSEGTATYDRPEEKLHLCDSFIFSLSLSLVLTSNTYESIRRKLLSLLHNATLAPRSPVSEDRSPLCDFEQDDTSETLPPRPDIRWKEFRPACFTGLHSLGTEGATGQAGSHVGLREPGFVATRIGNASWFPQEDVTDSLNNFAAGGEVEPMRLRTGWGAADLADRELVRGAGRPFSLGGRHIRRSKVVFEEIAVKVESHTHDQTITSHCSQL